MILFTLDIKYLKKQMVCYLIISIFCFVFSPIYEIFSHGIYSKFMRNAYLIPLIFGFGLTFLLYFFKFSKLKRISLNLYNASLATFTVYFLFKGVLEIYGTSNDLLNIYVYIGVILGVLSLILYCLTK